MRTSSYFAASISWPRRPRSSIRASALFCPISTPVALFRNRVHRTSSDRFLKEHADKNYYVIAYINCSAGVKALSDVICTSGNADKIVRAAPADRNILFVPDQNLGAWVMERTGRKMDLWQGNCYVHVEFTARSIGKIREEYPDAPVVAHPECTYAVRMLADEVCSTEKMMSFAKLAGPRNHRRDRSGDVTSFGQGDSGQIVYPRAD